MGHQHRLIPLHLTRPMSTVMNETLPSRSVRLPFRVPTLSRRWRVVIRNVNFRANVAYPGAVTIRTIAVGDAQCTASGQPTGAFGHGSDDFPQGPTVRRYDALVKDLGQTAWTSDWFTETLRPDRDYLLAYGYRTNGQVLHRGIAGGWWTGGRPLNAELVTDPSATRTRRPPLDVRIELDAATDVSTQLVLGDSIAAGSSASFPILEAPVILAARSGHIPWPVLHTFGGATMTEWIGGWSAATNKKWHDILRYGNHQRTLLALGSNDIHAGKDLRTMQTNCKKLIELVQARIASEVVACTVTPRRSWAEQDPAKERVRRDFNDWLAGRPDGVAHCVDTAAAVTDATGSAPLGDGVDTDGTHFTTSGSLRLARALRGEDTTERG